MLFICVKNIDLHALTGWIPERMSFSSIEKDSLMKLLISRYDKGDVLVTFATGEFSQTEEDRTGLVPGHAYAMLDVKFVQVIIYLIYSHLIINMAFLRINDYFYLKILGAT